MTSEESDLKAGGSLQSERFYLGDRDAVKSAGCVCSPVSDSGDIRGEEVDAVTVEVAAGSVVVLGGAGVGMAGQDLRVSQRDPGVQGVGDGSVPQRVGADVPVDAGDLGNPEHHPVDVSTVDRLPGCRAPCKGSCRCGGAWDRRPAAQC